jgi:hypothetical protein
MRTDHRARSLYLEMRAHGLEILGQADPDQADCYRVFIAADTLQALDPRTEEKIRERVRGNRAGLVRVLLDQADPDVRAVLQEGAD